MPSDRQNAPLSILNAVVVALTHREPCRRQVLADVADLLRGQSSCSHFARRAASCAATA